MFCKNCGTQIDDGNKFCPNCGNVIENSTEQTVVQPTYQAPVVLDKQPAQQGKGLAIASLVLGIVALVLFCIWYISIPCGIVGLVLGAVAANKAKQENSKNSMATAGIVCSSIALALCVLLILLAVIGVGLAQNIRY